MNYAAAIVDIVILVGTGYIVFWRGESGWWFLLALLLICMTGGYIPIQKKDK